MRLVSGVRRPGAAGPDSGGHRQQPRPARGAGARGRGASPRGDRQVVPLSPGRWRRPPTASAGRLRRTRTTTPRIRAATYGFQLSWEIDLFGRLRRGQESAIALALASEQGRRGVMVTLVGDVATNYFLLRELDLQMQIARETLRLNDETVTYFRNRLERRRVESSRARPHSGASRADRRRDPGNRAPDRSCRESDFAAARAPPEPRDAPGPDQHRTAAATHSSGASRVPARAAAGRRPGRTGARRVERRYRRREVAVLPDDQPDGISGRLSAATSPRSSAGRGACGRSGSSLFQPIFQAGRIRRNLEAAQARFDAALAEYQKAALNSYREVANSLVTIQKLAEQRGHRELGVTALQDASELSRERYESGLASYIEILTADQQLFEQQLLLAQTRGAELRARAELYRALGGGWQPEP